MRPESTPRRQRRYNPAELAFLEAARSHGWIASKRGWPDFWMVRGGKLAFVEVKPTATTPLKTCQDQVMSHLAAHGIACYVWTPDGGFKRFRL